MAFDMGRAVFGNTAAIAFTPRGRHSASSEGPLERSPDARSFPIAMLTACYKEDTDIRFRLTNQSHSQEQKAISMCVLLTYIFLLSFFWVC